MLAETQTSGSLTGTTACLGTRSWIPAQSTSGDQAGGINLATGTVHAMLSETLSLIKESGPCLVGLCGCPLPGRKGGKSAPSRCRPRGKAVSGRVPLKHPGASPPLTIPTSKGAAAGGHRGTMNASSRPRPAPAPALFWVPTSRAPPSWKCTFGNSCPQGCS